MKKEGYFRLSWLMILSIIMESRMMYYRNEWKYPVSETVLAENKENYTRLAL